MYDLVDTVKSSGLVVLKGGYNMTTKIHQIIYSVCYVMYAMYTLLLWVIIHHRVKKQFWKFSNKCIKYFSC